MCIKSSSSHSESRGSFFKDFVGKNLSHEKMSLNKMQSTNLFHPKLSGNDLIKTHLKNTNILLRGNSDRTHSERLVPFCCDVAQTFICRKFKYPECLSKNGMFVLFLLEFTVRKANKNIHPVYHPVYTLYTTFGQPEDRTL